MRCKVTMIAAGQIFEDLVIARDFQDAKRVALQRSPNARVLKVTAIAQAVRNTFRAKTIDR